MVACMTFSLPDLARLEWTAGQNRQGLHGLITLIMGWSSELIETWEQHGTHGKYGIASHVESRGHSGHSMAYGIAMHCTALRGIAASVRFFRWQGYSSGLQPGQHVKILCGNASQAALRGHLYIYLYIDVRIAKWHVDIYIYYNNSNNKIKIRIKLIVILIMIL